MFKFDFPKTNPANSSDTGGTDAVDIDVSERILPAEISQEINWNELSTTICVEDIKMAVVDSLKIVDYLKSVGSGKMSIIQADNGHTDLLPGVYEGGMKIWESTFDLGVFLSKRSEELLKGKSILDLGCGSGILGIIALKKGCNSVHFQDFNRDVIGYFTIPNVQLNSDDFLPKAQFWSGDWKSYEEVDNSQFDVIVTSETIYNPQSYKKLHDVIWKKLKPGGLAYLAGKSYYFGVGGSIKGFMDFVIQENVLFVTPLWSSDAGVRREIILLEHQPQSPG